MKRKDFIKSTGLFMLIPSLLSGIAPRNPKDLGPTFFTPEMLRRNNVGLFIINIKAGDVVNSKNPGYCATVAWKLTWALKHWKNSDGNRGEFPTHSMCNVFTDGWICPIGNTDEDVCEYLNNNPYGETFRLMTKEEVIYLITNRKQGFL